MPRPGLFPPPLTSLSLLTHRTPTPSIVTHWESEDVSGSRPGEKFLNNGELGLFRRRPGAPWDPSVCDLDLRRFLWNLRWSMPHIPRVTHWQEWEQRRNNIPSPLKRAIFSKPQFKRHAVPWAAQSRGRGTLEHLVEALMYARHC